MRLPEGADWRSMCCWPAKPRPSKRSWCDWTVLIRASGTEPLLRVMVEARDAAQASICAERLAQAARQGMMAI